MIAIDKKIPIPNADRSRGRKPIYPFRDMAVGDSFLAPAKKYNSVASIACRRHLPKEFTIRKITSELIRVWRVK